MTSADDPRQADEPTPNEGGDERLAPAVVAALYGEHAAELRRMLVGVLRDESLAADVMQAAFAKCLEQGHASRAESRKSWLFRVAYCEALAWRRRLANGERIVRQVAEGSSGQLPVGPESGLVREEEAAAVREALAALPAEQREVVRLRIYDEKTFAEIAEQLQIPLGTALTRMRTALARLRTSLERLRR